MGFGIRGGKFLRSFLALGLLNLRTFSSLANWNAGLEHLQKKKTTSVGRDHTRNQVDKYLRGTAPRRNSMQKLENTRRKKFYAKCCSLILL